jgi:hypothetical protein
MVNREQLSADYLDWVNNYLTIEVFAEHRGLSIVEAEALIKLGNWCFSNLHPEA